MLMKKLAADLVAQEQGRDRFSQDSKRCRELAASWASRVLPVLMELGKSGQGRGMLGQYERGDDSRYGRQPGIVFYLRVNSAQTHLDQDGEVMPIRVARRRYKVWWNSGPSGPSLHVRVEAVQKISYGFARGTPEHVWRQVSGLHLVRVCAALLDEEYSEHYEDQVSSIRAQLARIPKHLRAGLL